MHDARGRLPAECIVSSVHAMYLDGSSLPVSAFSCVDHRQLEGLGIQGWRHC